MLQYHHSCIRACEVCTTWPTMNQTNLTNTSNTTSTRWAINEGSLNHYHKTSNVCLKTAIVTKLVLKNKIITSFNRKLHPLWLLRWVIAAQSLKTDSANRLGLTIIKWLKCAKILLLKISRQFSWVTDRTASSLVKVSALMEWWWWTRSMACQTWWVRVN